MNKTYRSAKTDQAMEQLGEMTVKLEAISIKLLTCKTIKIKQNYRSAQTRYSLHVSKNLGFKSEFLSNSCLTKCYQTKSCLHRWEGYPGQVPACLGEKDLTQTGTWQGIDPQKGSWGTTDTSASFHSPHRRTFLFPHCILWILFFFNSSN